MLNIIEPALHAVCNILTGDDTKPVLYLAYAGCIPALRELLKIKDANILKMAYDRLESIGEMIEKGKNLEVNISGTPTESLTEA